MSKTVIPSTTLDVVQSYWVNAWKQMTQPAIIHTNLNRLHGNSYIIRLFWWTLLATSISQKGVSHITSRTRLQFDGGAKWHWPVDCHFTCNFSEISCYSIHPFKVKLGEMLFNVHDDVIKWKHFPRNWPFVWGIHRSPVNSLHKGPWRVALMFSLICVWINDRVNNREAGDLRRYRAHYDVIEMLVSVVAANACTNSVIIALGKIHKITTFRIHILRGVRLTKNKRSRGLF